MNTEAILQRARLLLQQNRYELAAEQLMQVLTQEPNIAEAHSLLALCMLQNKDRWHDATREAEQAIHLEPDEAMCHYVLACVLDKRSRPDEAIRSIREAIRLDSGQSGFYALHASLLSQKDQWKQAYEASSLGLQVDPDDTACSSMRALSLERLGRTTDALHESERAVARDPDSSDAHSMRGWALLQKGQYQESQVAFREALRLEPTHEFARTGMIQALNSKNLIFRMMFKFHSMASRLASGSQWMLIIGLFVGMRLLRAFANANPEWEPYVTPISILYLAFCMLSWIADPVLNAFLRFHPFGKYLLSPMQKLASGMVSGLLLIAIINVLVLAIQGDFPGAMLMGLVPLFMTIPVTIAFHVDRGWPSWIAVPGAIMMFLLATIIVSSYYLGLPWGLPILAFFAGIFVCSLGGQILLKVTVRH
jgi:Flp pilus assembly protein TadD